MYFPLIDLARFFAALAVMSHHYFYHSFENSTGILPFIINHGGLGVQLFFIISGFVIHFSINKGILNYFINRLSRIYPLFWIICTITFILTIIIPPHAHQSIFDYLKNMSIIFKDGNFATYVDGSYWTLRYELIFYVLVGLFIFLFKPKQIKKFYILLTLASLLITILNKQNSFIGKILIAKFALFFTFGGYLADIIIKQYKKIKINFIDYLIIILLPILFIFENYIFKINKDDVALYGSDLVCVLVFFIIIPTLAVISKNIKNSRFINYCKMLGMMTYPLYLIHQKPGQVFGGIYYGKLNIVMIIISIIMITLSYLIAKKEVIIRNNIIAWVLKSLKQN